MNPEEVPINRLDGPRDMRWLYEAVRWRRAAAARARKKAKEKACREPAKPTSAAPDEK